MAIFVYLFSNKGLSSKDRDDNLVSLFIFALLKISGELIQRQFDEKYNLMKYIWREQVWQKVQFDEIYMTRIIIWRNKWYFFQKYFVKFYFLSQYFIKLYISSIWFRHNVFCRKFFFKLYFCQIVHFVKLSRYLS